LRKNFITQDLFETNKNFHHLLYFNQDHTSAYLDNLVTPERDYSTSAQPKRCEPFFEYRSVVFA